MIYIWTYKWQRHGMSQPKVETEVTRRHPLLEWSDTAKRNPDENHQLLWYRPIGDERLGDLELQRLIDYALQENSGELHPVPDDWKATQ
jgi:hypothetical protein